MAVKAVPYSELLSRAHNIQVLAVSDEDTRLARPDEYIAILAFVDIHAGCCVEEKNVALFAIGYLKLLHLQLARPAQFILKPSVLEQKVFTLQLLFRKHTNTTHLRARLVQILQIFLPIFIRKSNRQGFILRDCACWDLVYFKFVWLINGDIIKMGLSQSQQKMDAVEKDYLKEFRTHHQFFGEHLLLTHRIQRKLMICKSLIFKSSAQVNQFLEAYDKIDRKPFNILYPTCLLKNYGVQTCTDLYEVRVYYDLIGKNLTQVIKTQGVFSQSRAWFLLNQMSKALQILSESGRPHWAICPQNIYQNEYQNYFVFDSFFAIGVDPQSFLRKRLQNGELMSQKMRLLLEKGFTVSPAEGFEEDCFCLGYVLLFVLTGIHHRSLPQDPIKRSDAVRHILYERRSSIDPQLIEIIEQLTQRESLRRMDNYQLRRYLKDKQADIIRNQESDYEKSRKHAERPHPQATQQKLHLSKSPQHPYSPHYHQTLRSIPYQHQGRLISHQQNALTRPRQLTFAPNGFQSFPMMMPLQRNLHQSHHGYKQGQVISSSERSNTLTRINSYDRLISKH